MIIRSVGVLSVGKVMGIIYAILGLIIGGIFALFSLAIGAAAGPRGQPAGFGMMFGVFAIVLWPVFYGVAGFIGGLILGGLYNLVAGMAGGIEIELTRPARDDDE